LTEDPNYVLRKVSDTNNSFFSLSRNKTSLNALNKYFDLQSKNLINIDNLQNLYYIVKGEPFSEDTEIQSYLDYEDIERYQPELIDMIKVDKRRIREIKVSELGHQLLAFFKKNIRATFGFQHNLSNTLVHRKNDCNFEDELTRSGKKKIKKFDCQRNNFKNFLNNDYAYKSIRLSEILKFFQKLGFKHVNIIEQSCSSLNDETEMQQVYEDTDQLSELAAPTLRRQYSETEKSAYQDFAHENPWFGGSKKTRKRKNKRKSRRKSRRSKLKKRKSR
jgi:hypothetical protein